MKTILYEIVGDVLLLVHGESAPSDEEWEPYVRLMDTRFKQLRGILVVTDGAGPNSAQRSKINDNIQRHGNVLTAVVTHSPVARGIVTALGWFHSTIRAFAPSQLTAALTFLTVEPARQEHLLRRVVALRSALAAQGAVAPEAPAEMGMEPTIARLNELMSKRLPALRSELSARRSP